MKIHGHNKMFTVALAAEKTILAYHTQ